MASCFLSQRTMGANAFHHIFRFFGYEAFRQRHLWNANVGQTVGAVAQSAGQVDMAHTLPGVVMMADAVFLRSGTIIDVVQQVGFAQQRERTE